MSITCLMVTGNPRGYFNMPEVAVQCFLDQSYEDCELLIINHGTKNFTGKNVIDFKVSKTPTTHVGELRNMAFDKASGDYIACWDDDDWHHPHRLEFSAQFLSDDSMFMLRSRMTIDLSSSIQGVQNQIWGCMNTMIYPKKTKLRFPNMASSSDAVFVDMFRKLNPVSNDPTLYVRTAHGDNITHYGGIMSNLTPLNPVQSRQAAMIRGLYKPAPVKDK